MIFSPLASDELSLPAKSVGGFVQPAADSQGSRRRIVAVYLDCSNFKDIGDGHTIADQINEVFEPYNLAVIKASNDRLGGWQLTGSGSLNTP